ncbi:molybdopterin-guanine dinucleotide biosynthesis protein B [Enterovibrio baiacu]|uniref:molybdopterin-guanine dinucleotide biosynthesis protein B n=1 Tax=Enterovibrio baiacu TaxID=2491023 RepID=UPI001011687B|nr:molybdopterin-guanine dinucleotide biosynthesis protein B [Enterovibrio baiacu]MBE1273932.1 molybdopterin-guanine dinucleotide biosynthesis protein B [Enterovibrio baiacu]
MLTNRLKPVIGFAGFSGSGKTTLLEGVIPLLKRSGLRVGLLKHSHHNIEPDSPRKDSYRLRYAGSDQLLLATSSRHMLFFEYHDDEEREPELKECLAQLDLNKLDIVLVEGFRDASLTKIEVHRPSHGKPLLCEHDRDIIAIATDSASPLCVSNDIPQLDINSHEAVAGFIKHWLETATDLSLYLGFGEKDTNHGG